jgi:hypothetical protein
VKKQLLILIILFIVSFTTGFTQDLAHNHTCSEHQHKNETNSTYQTVYVCTGNYAYAYHSRDNCAGLNNCKGEIRYTDVYSAINTHGRKPCCRCWPGVYGNCKEDNPYNTGGSSAGGGDGEAYVALAVVVVSLSAIILSNDIYFHPAISYEQEVGMTFGLRKTFKRCALEYGGSYFENRDFGGHFSFIHHILYNQVPEKYIPYIGPTINIVDDVGGGIILGTSIVMNDRFKFDFRWEVTSQTNQIQAGIIIKYQKKYFWQKNKDR